LDFGTARFVHLPLASFTLSMIEPFRFGTNFSLLFNTQSGASRRGVFREKKRRKRLQSAYKRIGRLSISLGISE